MKKFRTTLFLFIIASTVSSCATSTCDYFCDLYAEKIVLCKNYIFSDPQNVSTDDIPTITSTCLDSLIPFDDTYTDDVCTTMITDLKNMSCTQLADALQ